MKKSYKIIIISISAIVVVLLCAINLFSLYIKNTYLSKEEVKKIIIEDTQLNEENITFKEIDLDLDEEIKKYDVEFYYNRIEYKYEIDARNGKIIYSNYVTDKNNDNLSTENNNNNNYISVEEAKNIALNDAQININEVTFTDVDLENKNGKVMYEVDFYYNNFEYEYKIDGISKDIISKNREFRD